MSIKQQAVHKGLPGAARSIKEEELHPGSSTGKTFVYSLLLDTIRSRGDIAIAVASSGLAALLMPGGRTAHSRFGIPIPIENSTHCK